MIALWEFLIGNQKIGLENGAISIRDKKFRRRCRSIGKGKLFGEKGVWVRWRIRWGEIRSKVGWYGRNVLGVSLMRTGWVGRGRHKWRANGDMVVNAGSRWYSWYLSLSWGVAEGSLNHSEKLDLWRSWLYERNWLARTGRNGLTGWRDWNGQDEVRAGE